MSLPKQLINLLGFVVVVAVVALGVVVFGLPMYTQSLNTDAETARVSQTNSQYDIQVQSLQAAKKKLPETQQEVAQLRTQISVPNHLEDAFELAINAADSTKSTITKMTAADVEPFTARTTVGDDGKAEAAPAPAADTTTDASASASTTDAAASGSTASTAPAPAPSAPAADARTQAPLTITVDVPSPAAAARYLDELRKGPRLIAITHSALAGGGASDDKASYTLTVDALAFIRTTD